MNEIDIQRFLKAKNFYKGAIDGILGPMSIASMRLYLQGIAKGWSAKRLQVGVMQKMCEEAGIDPGPIDGLPGPLTADAIDEWERLKKNWDPIDPNWREYRTPEQASRWPTQAECNNFYGVPEKTVPAQMTRVPTPFTLWYGDMAVNEFYVHSKCAKSLLAVFNELLQVYGLEEIHRLRIDRYAGIYNPRRMRGGSAWSMHSYGCAIDLDPMNNRLRWGRDRASFARPEYVPLHEAFEREGWINLGREANFDYMHFQAARLR